MSGLVGTAGLFASPGATIAWVVVAVAAAALVVLGASLVNGIKNLFGVELDTAGLSPNIDRLLVGIAVISFATIPFGATFQAGGQTVRLQVWDPSYGALWPLVGALVGCVLVGLTTTTAAPSADQPPLTGEENGSHRVSQSLLTLAIATIPLLAVFMYSQAVRMSVVVANQTGQFTDIGGLSWAPSWNIITLFPSFMLLMAGCLGMLLQREGQAVRQHVETQDSERENADQELVEHDFELDDDTEEDVVVRTVSMGVNAAIFVFAAYCAALFLGGPEVGVGSQDVTTGVLGTVFVPLIVMLVKTTIVLAVFFGAIAWWQRQTVVGTGTAQTQRPAALLTNTSLLTISMFWLIATTAVSTLRSTGIDPGQIRLIVGAGVIGVAALVGVSFITERISPSAEDDHS